MKRKITHLLMLVAAVCLTTLSHAQLSLGTLNTNHVINFSSTVSGVNNGAFNRASGNAIFATPAGAGQLDNAGFSLALDGASAQAAASFPGPTQNAGFAHQTGTIGTYTTTSTGIGSAAIDANNMLAVFPAGGVATAGSITLRVNNSTGSSYNRLLVSYKVVVLNNGPRSNRVGFFHSADNTLNSYTEVTSANYNSVESSTPVTRDSITRSITIDIPAGVSNGSSYFLRWFFDDVSGSGNRDKFFLDDITIQPQSISLPNVSISLSSGSGTESGTSSTTITATASTAVTGNQTINLLVTGSGVTTGDYTLSSTTITILDGQTTGTATLTVNNDNLNEATETLNITLSGPSSGISIGSPNTATYSITDNDGDLILTTLGAFLGVQTMDQLSATATGTSAADIPTGFYFKENGSSANGFYAANDGSSGTGNTYAYGTGTSTDRAFGSIGATGLLTTHFGFRLQNNTGATANKLVLNYVGEQWRDGGTASDRLDVQISLNANSIDDSSATWIDLNSLDFIPPGTLNTGIALDGNLPANQVALADTTGGFGNIPNNATFWIRWVDTDSPGTDDGVAVDNVNVALLFETPSVFYSKPVGSLRDLNTWNSEPDFSGSAPASFTAPNSTFNLVNRTSVTLDDTLTISGSNTILVVGDGVSATELFNTATIPLYISGGASLRIAANSTFHAVHFIMPALNSVQGTNSTISFEQPIGATTIPSGNYVNLTLKNAVKNLGTGTFNISGNLTLENTTSIAPGSPFASIVLGGNFTLVNTNAFTGSESITMTTTGNGTQTFDAGNGTMTFFRLISTKTSGGINVVKNTNNAVELVCRDDYRLNMSGTATFTDNGSTLQCGGDFNCDGSSSNYTFTGTLVMNGTVAAQNIRRSEASSTLIQADLNNITFTGGTATGLFFQPTGSSSNMTIKGNLTLTPSLPYTGNLNLGTNKNLFLNGNLTITGVTLSGTGSVIELSGTAAQNIASTNTNSVANSRLTGLRINNASGVSYTTTDTLEVANNLTVVNGTLNTNDAILIRSTGNLLHGAGTPTAGGNVNGQIIINRNSNNTSLTTANLWTSPVATGFLSNIGGLDHNMFDASLQVWQIQGMGNPVTNAMPVGRGYIVYGGGDATFRGLANNGNIAVPIVNNATKTDWNLVGNPYPSGVLLDEVISIANNPSITGTVYVWDRTITDYRAYNNLNAGLVIPAGQGFFVEATATGNINFTNSMRSTSNGTFLRSQNNFNKFSLSITGANLYNKTDLAFGNGATTGFDHGLDARKFRGNQDISLYTINNTDDLCIQTLPAITSALVVPVGVEAIAGTYDISIEDLEIDPTIQVYLEDNGTMFNLRNGSYSFTLNQTSTLRNRFRLHFQPMITTSVPTINEENMVIGMNGRQLLVKASDENTTISTIQITDLSGRIVRQLVNLNATGNFNQEIDLTAGIYLVTVKTNSGKVQTAKVLAR